MARVTPKARLVVSAVERKASAAARRVPRALARQASDEFDHAHRPPVIVTTVPKSGTHLVQQIVTALPGARDYGTFLATVPSWARRPRSAATEARRIGSLAPGELARAHLHHRPEVVDAVRERGAFVVFVHRDPRDVIVSEAHYLTDSAPWHTLHREFARRPPSERVDIGIDGLEGHHGIYPDVGRRFALFEGWLDDADVVLRFEDLVSDRRYDVVRNLVTTYRRASQIDFDADAVVSGALDAIDPHSSHTFREGRTGAWRDVFTPEQAERVVKVAGPMLDRFGYPQTGV